MSLINDALKKARNQNTVTVDPNGSASTPAGLGSSAYRNAPSASNPFIWILATFLITGLAVACAVLVMMLFYQTDAKSVTNATEVTQALAQEVTTASETATIAEPLAALDLHPAPANELAGKPSSETDTSANKEPQAVAATTPSESAPPAPLSQPAASDRIETITDSSNPSQAVVYWLAESTINGVRIAGQQSRVMLNGRSYRLGETVNFELGIVVRAIQENRVLFEDALGARYVKHF
jgi:hypothetical protein